MLDDKLFELQIISPDRTFFEGKADMLELRTTEGEIGILKGHIPLTAIIAPGFLRIMNSGEIKEAAIHDGFMEILGDKVMILAEACEWPDEIDINRASEAKIRAERKLQNSGEEANTLHAEMALRRSLIRLELAEKHSKR